MASIYPPFDERLHNQIYKLPFQPFFVSNNIGIFISFSTGLFEQLDERIDMKKKERKERKEIKYFKINL